METANSPSSSFPNTNDQPPPPAQDSSQKTTGKDELFQCNICLEPPNDPVASYCGHIFCWPCLHEWLSMKPEGTQTCPVCNAAIDREKVIPLYGRNSKGEDPRKKAVPPRPQAQRTEQTRTGQYGSPFEFAPFGFGGAAPAGGFHMTLGFGAFPFAVMANMFTGGNAGQGQADQGLVSRLFFGFAVFMILLMLFY